MACSDVCTRVAPILSALKVPSVVLGCNDRTLDDADLFLHFLQLETQSGTVKAVKAVLAIEAFTDAPQRISDSEVFDDVAEYFTQLCESLDVTIVTSPSEDVDDIIEVMTVPGHCFAQLGRHF